MARIYVGKVVGSNLEKRGTSALPLTRGGQGKRCQKRDFIVAFDCAYGETDMIDNVDAVRSNEGETTLSTRQESADQGQRFFVRKGGPSEHCNV